MFPPSATIALIGFGEAGGILGADLAKRGCAMRAYDILLDDPATREPMLARLAAAGVDPAPSLAEALQGAKLVISAVTAAASQDVARAAGPLLREGQLFLDLNSVSPDTKRACAAWVQASGAAYVEAAVMAPVPPQRLQVPMLLGGARAADLAPALTALGMNAQAVAQQIGVASAIKMCRSVMIKGLEALAVESLLSARHYGAEDAVLASLAATFPSLGWTAQQPDYLISRVAEHGRRRAAELREAAATVSAAGIEPRMALATAASQDALVEAMAEAGISYERESAFSWRSLADRLATSRSGRGKKT
jgi:3-hydroxyisobutyrate dehydrogenase-like beta-hydroxyacid dehydrogenase